MRALTLLQVNSRVLMILKFFTIAFLFLAISGCRGEISELKQSYTVHGVDKSASSPTRIFLFSADYGLGESFPDTTMASPGERKSFSGVAREIHTTEIKLPERALLEISFVFAVPLLFIWLIIVTLIFAAEKNYAPPPTTSKPKLYYAFRDVFELITFFVVTLAICWLFYTYAPAWCFLWIQWILFPFIFITLLFIYDEPAPIKIDGIANENEPICNRIKSMISISWILLLIAICIYSGTISGERIVIDNALEKNVTVKIQDARGAFIEFPMPPKTYTRIRIPGNEWTIETNDGSKNIEKLTVSRKMGFFSSMIHWFFALGEVCYNVGGANSYSIVTAVYY